MVLVAEALVEEKFTDLRAEIALQLQNRAKFLVLYERTCTTIVYVSVCLCLKFFDAQASVCLCAIFWGPEEESPVHRLATTLRVPGLCVPTPISVDVRLTRNGSQDAEENRRTCSTDKTRPFGSSMRLRGCRRTGATALKFHSRISWKKAAALPAQGKII